jgi:Lrp/AsnC family leucine-responsive transcriptional regulator
MIQLDVLDLKIIEILKENSKLSYKEIADKIGLSTTPTYERIKRLEKNNIILKYTIHENKVLLDKGMKVYCQVSLKGHNKELIELFEKEVIKLKEVVTLHHIAGNMDYLLFIETKDIETYHHFLREKLASIPNIANVQSSFVLKSLKN